MTAKLLAAAGNDELFKVVFGLIAVLLWAIKASTAGGKSKQRTQQEQEKLRAVRDSIVGNLKQISQSTRPRSASRNAPPQTPPVRLNPAIQQRIPSFVTSPPRVAQTVKRQILRTPFTGIRRTAPVSATLSAPVPAAPRIVPAAVPAVSSMLASGKPSIASNQIRSAGTSLNTKTSPQADALSLRRWLKPAILHQQFVMTEILRPPLALREPE